MQKLREMQWTLSLMVSPVTLEIFTRWIDDGTVTSIIAARREDSAKRQALAREVLGECGSFAATNSYNIWLHLPGDWTATDFVSEAQRRGVLVTPPHLFAIGRTSDEAVRICLAAADNHAQLRSALETIAEILQGTSAETTGTLAV
jgi:DNA-binding transcriptional MocR family regulator